jgi:hypothetical protein
MTISTAQRRIIQNGLGVILVGLIGGFFLGWNVIGFISFPPLPIQIDYPVPGTTAAWRAVHTGNVMNGVMALGLAAIFPWFDLSKRMANTISWMIAGIVWGNSVFYIAAVFAPNRGLSMGDNAAGAGSIAGIIAYVPAIAAAYALIFVVLLLLFRLKTASD